MYPRSSRPSAQIEPGDESGVWNINGCCGGGCYVVTNVRFCPFCGHNLKEPVHENISPPHAPVAHAAPDH